MSPGFFMTFSILRGGEKTELSAKNCIALCKKGGRGIVTMTIFNLFLISHGHSHFKSVTHTSRKLVSPFYRYVKDIDGR